MAKKQAVVREPLTVEELLGIHIKMAEERLVGRLGHLGQELLRMAVLIEARYQTGELRSTDFNSLGIIQCSGNQIDNLCGTLGAFLDAREMVLKKGEE